MKITYFSQTGNSPFKLYFLHTLMDCLLLALVLYRNTTKTNAKVKSSPSESVNFIQIFPALFALFCRISVVFMNKKVLRVKHESI